MSEAADLIKALTALAWPLLAAVVVWRLFPIIKSITASRNFTVKIAGMEVSVQEATEKIGQQLSDLNSEVLALRSSSPGSEAALSLSPPVEAPLPSSGPQTILWVDDKPSGNAFEVAQLQERGMDVVQACSTAEAMGLLERSLGFAAVVSDMGRVEDGTYRPQAGLTLLRSIRQRWENLPFLVYTGRRSAISVDEEVRREGGDGATASTVQLFEWLTQRIRQNPR